MKTGLLKIFPVGHITYAYPQEIWYDKIFSCDVVGNFSHPLHFTMNIFKTACIMKGTIIFI